MRVVRDMVKAQPYSFNELNGLVISEVLNLHQDEDKGVSLQDVYYGKRMVFRMRIT